LNEISDRICLVYFPVAAWASPAPEYVCFDRAFSAMIGFDEGWSAVYMTNNWGEFELQASEGQGGPDNSFSFENATYSFTGIAPEGQIKTGETVFANCYQTGESIKAIALYGNPENRGIWSKYQARGQGFQTVRSTPSVLGEKIAALPQGEPVIILENTGAFLDGFFWFKIEFSEGEQVYIWGALLCTDTDDPELKATVRSGS
jgi:hypothetical protein